MKRTYTATPEYRAARAARRLRNRYGLTPEQYERLLSVQQGGCAICGNACTTGRRLSVDHAHRADCDWRARQSRDNACGCPVRGLLCQRCNAALSVIERGDEGAVTPARLLYLRKTEASA